MKKKKLLGLTVTFLFLVLGSMAVFFCGTRQKHPLYEEMVDSAGRMEACTKAIKEERLRRGIPLSAEDLLGTGMIGVSSSAITTTSGAVEAKRTSALPDMAALCVRLLDEAGLQAGDTVGACFSGSFPGLNLALVCAADAMDIEIIYTASIGASSFGANLPEFTSPEMLTYVYEQGLISTAPAGVTMGGDKDMGENMLGFQFPDMEMEISAMEKRLEEKGISIVKIEDYPENLEWRMDLYGEIDGFVNVGGNIAGMGADGHAYNHGQGVLSDSGNMVNEKTGLLERYLRKGIPVVQLLNLRQLCFSYGLEYDPENILLPGESHVYWIKEYSRGAIMLVAGLTIASLGGLCFRKGESGHIEKGSDKN